MFFQEIPVPGKDVQTGVKEWAYVGDAVASLYVRTRLIREGIRKDISGQAIRYVSAAGQAEGMDYLKDLLTEEEYAIYRRGHNANVGVRPRNVHPALYTKATGFETLIGYLYLENNRARVEELLRLQFDWLTQQHRDD